MNAEKLKNFKDYADALPEVLKENFLTLSGINADTKQAAVASALGVGDSTITSWKKSGPTFNADTVARIAATYNVDPALLLKKDMRIDCQPETIGDAVRVLKFLRGAFGGKIETMDDGSTTVTLNNEFLHDFFVKEFDNENLKEQAFATNNKRMAKVICDEMEKLNTEAQADANNMPLSVYGSREMWHMFQKIADIFLKLSDVTKYASENAPLSIAIIDMETKTPLIECNSYNLTEAAADFDADLIASVYDFSNRYIDKFGHAAFMDHVAQKLPSGNAKALRHMTETFSFDILTALYDGIINNIE